MTRPLLKIESLSCAREGRRLFSDLSFMVSAGDCVELTGPNGSGKSTLLRCIAGLFPDFDGSIDTDGLLYLGHKSSLSQLLSPLDNLRWYQSLQGAGGDALAAIERVGLAGYEDILCQNLSAGQQRRAALARLLLADELLWLLDEPFTALDTAGIELVRSLLREHVERGGAVVCATHQGLGHAGAVSLRLGAGL